MKLFEKLRLKLNEEFGFDLPEHTKFQRTYAGHWQLSQGAWKWRCNYTEFHCDIGSPYTATEILKAKKLSEFRPVYDIEILVED